MVERLPAPRWPRWLAAMLPFERQVLRVAGKRIHVMFQGSGRPVLMLHGNPTWGFLYRKVAAALIDAPLRLIIPDLVGLGFSERVPASEHTLEAHARWQGALIDALDLDDLIFVGQDWGGPIGLRALADRPERVAGLVLMNTVASPPRPDFTPTLFHRLSQLPVLSDLLFRGLGFPQRALWAAQADRRSIHGRVARAYRYPLRGLRRNAAPLALARMVPDSLDHPSVPDLRRCQEFVSGFQGCSALVWGRRDPILGGVVRWMRALLPDATVRLTDAGHFLQEEVPDVIAEAIREVAARC